MGRGSEWKSEGVGVVSATSGRDSIDWTHQLRQIERLYEAAVDRSQWKPFLDDVSATLGTTGGNVAVHSHSRGEISYIEQTLLTQSQLIRYNDEMFAYDYWHSAFKSAPAGMVGSNRDNLIGPPQEFTQTKFYQEWVVDTPMFYGAGSYFTRQGDRHGVVGFFRPEADGDLPPDAKAYLQSFVPHLQMAFKIQEHIDQLDCDIRSYREQLDGHRIGDILLDRKGAVVFCNATARKYLCKGGLFVSSARLVCEFAAQQSALDCALACVLADPRDQTDGTTLAVQRGASPEPLYVTVSPFYSERRSELLHERPKVMVHLRDPGDFDHVDQDDLRSLFKLTPRESMLVMTLTRGATLADYALANGIAKATARVQLKSVFRKFDVRSQHQLVAAVLNTLR